MMAAVAFWSLTYALEMASVSLAGKIFWAKAEYLGIVIVPLAWFAFALEYTNHARLLTRRNVFLVSLFPILMVILVWTNELHGWVWRTTTLDVAEKIPVLNLEHSGAFWLFAGYSYFLIFAGTILVFQAFIRQSNLGRKQAGVILVAAMIPWLGNILYLSGAIPLLHIDLTLFAFALSGILAMIGLVRFRILDILPVAHKVIFENLADGVIVLDTKDRIVEVNPAAVRLLELQPKELIGQPIDDVLNYEISRWSSILPKNIVEAIGEYLKSPAIRQEIRFGDGDKQETYELRISPIIGENGEYAGRMVMWSDLTDRRRIDDVLQNKLEENAQLIEDAQRRTHHLEGLNAIVGYAAAATDVQSLVDFALERALQSLNLNSGAVCIQGKMSSRGLPANNHDSPLVQAIQGCCQISSHPICVEDWDGYVENPSLDDLRRMMGRAQLRASLIVPIRTNTQLIGGVILVDRQPRRWHNEEIVMVETLSKQLGVAAERLHLFTTASEQAARMSRLAEISGNLNRTYTMSEVLEGIGHGALSLSVADRAAVFIREPDETATSPWNVGLSSDYLEAVIRRAKDMPGGQLFQQSDAVLIQDIQQLPELSPLKKLALAEGYQAIGLWPLIYEERVVAAVGCYYDTPYSWGEPQREVMQTFARQAAVALQNARLFEEIRRHAAQMEALNAIITTAATSSDLQSLLELVFRFSMEAMETQMGGVWAHGHMLETGLPEDFGRSTARLANQVNFKFTDTLVVDDWRDIPTTEALSALSEHMTGAGVIASLTVPILADGQLIGGLMLAGHSPRRWRTEDIALIESVGRQLGSAIDRLNLIAKTQEQAKQMAQILDTVPEGVIVLDNQQRILLTNPAARYYLWDLAGAIETGEPLIYLADRTVSDLLKPEEEWVEIGIEGQSRRVFEVAAQPLGGAYQNTGWVLVLRDVSLERENQARIQMQERLATVGQLAAGIAHDFNNIMAAIFVYTDLLMMDEGISHDNQERLTTIQQQVQRASSLIRQILDFSRRSVMEQSTLDLLPFIKELDKLLARVLPETIHMELVYHPDTYLVHADPTRLQQVFMNLALNARDAMPNGGAIRFSLDIFDLFAEETPPTPELSPGRWVRIEVTDTGRGIAPEVIPHIFEPFFTTKPVGQGTGLGLAQVYGIIKGHGGFIDVYSKPGDGSIFTMYLPALDAPEIEAPARDTLTGQSMGAGQAILLVEDDQAARDALQILLEQQNYQALTASNGLEALKVLDGAPQLVDLVISDVVMPEMDGVELYRVLRSQHPNVKVLFITGHPLDETSQSLLQGGQVHWMQKPFSASSFNHMVKDLLEEAPLQV